MPHAERRLTSDGCSITRVASSGRCAPFAMGSGTVNKIHIEYEQIVNKDCCNGEGSSVEDGSFLFGTRLALCLTVLKQTRSSQYAVASSSRALPSQWGLVQ